MSNDESPLTSEQGRRLLVAEIAHQRRLVSDAKACRLTEIHARRQKKLTEMLAKLTVLDESSRANTQET